MDTSMPVTRASPIAATAQITQAINMKGRIRFLTRAFTDSHASIIGWFPMRGARAGKCWCPRQI